MSATTRNDRLKRWVDEWAAVLGPDSVYWCDGSAEEYDRLSAELVEARTFTRLSDANRPNSYWAHSDPADVARVEDRTFICSASADLAGPNKRCFEYRHSPDPGVLENLLAPALAELRHNKIADAERPAKVADIASRRTKSR